MQPQTIKVGQVVNTINGQLGVVFSKDCLMIVVIQNRNDNIYNEISVFFHFI